MKENGDMMRLILQLSMLSLYDDNKMVSQYITHGFVK